jgi:programmed cell death 6-interacting protein
LDILDQEAEDDEVLQSEAQGSRIPSYEANKDLIMKAERYRHVLEEAAEKDEFVRDQWENWEENISQLTWSEVGVRTLVTKLAV